jgi:CheY-like chemotaxis protein
MIGRQSVMAIRVIVIEDDETWRFMYRRQLQGARDAVVVAEFERAEEALQQLPHLRPDVALVDYSLPGMSGLEFAERMREYPAVKLILVTGHEKEFLKKHNPHAISVVQKGDTRGLLDSLNAAVGE